MNRELVETLLRFGVHAIGSAASTITGAYTKKAAEYYRESRGESVGLKDQVAVVSASTIVGTLFSLGAGAVVSQIVSSGVTDIDIPKLPQGKHDFIAILTDEDGNVIQYTTDGVYDGEVFSTDNRQVYLLYVEEKTYEDSSDYDYYRELIG